MYLKIMVNSDDYSNVNTENDAFYQLFKTNTKFILR